jgi:hypothetical protein
VLVREAVLIDVPGELRESSDVANLQRACHGDGSSVSALSREMLGVSVVDQRGPQEGALLCGRVDGNMRAG